MDVTVDVYKDRMILVCGDKNLSVCPIEPYSTIRLLVGTFMPAVECLKGGLKQIGATGLFKSKPTLHIKACDLTEGGLSEIEKRCLHDVGLSAGAGKVESVTH